MNQDFLDNNFWQIREIANRHSVTGRKKNE